MSTTRKAPPVIAEAVSWWRSHRPVGWTEAEHVARPAINCVVTVDARLARAVAAWVKEQTR